MATTSTPLPTTSWDAFVGMMKPVLSAKDTDTTPTMMVQDGDDDTSSLQDPMDNNVMGTKPSSISKTPMPATTDDDTGATLSMDEDEYETIMVKMKPPSGDPPPSPPPSCASPPPPLDEEGTCVDMTRPSRALRLRG